MIWSFERFREIQKQANSESYSSLSHVELRNLPRCPVLRQRWSAPFKPGWITIAPLINVQCGLVSLVNQYFLPATIIQFDGFLSVLFPSKQCAAVKTWNLFMNEPPHICRYPFFFHCCKDTRNGQVFAVERKKVLRDYIWWKQQVGNTDFWTWLVKPLCGFVPWVHEKYPTE